MIQWHPDLLNGLIAPGIADFPSAEIVDLRDEFPEARYKEVADLTREVGRTADAIQTPP